MINIEERTITRKGIHTIQIRSLSPEEEQVLAEVLKASESYCLNVGTPRAYLDELMSFLNEELWLYACKFNGQGSLYGFLFHHMKLKRSWFLSSSAKKAQRQLKDSQTESPDGDETFNAWDSKADTTSMDSNNLGYLLDSLPLKERQLAEMMSLGYSMTEISEVLGIDRSGLYYRRNKLKELMVEHYGQDIGVNYSKMKLHKGKGAWKK